MHLKMSSVTWQPFCAEGDEFIQSMLFLDCCSAACNILWIPCLPCLTLVIDMHFNFNILTMFVLVWIEISVLWARLLHQMTKGNTGLSPYFWPTTWSVIGINIWYHIIFLIMALFWFSETGQIWGVWAFSGERMGGPHGIAYINGLV